VFSVAAGVVSNFKTPPPASVVYIDTVCTGVTVVFLNISFVTFTSIDGNVMVSVFVNELNECEVADVPLDRETLSILERYAREPRPPVQTMIICKDKNVKVYTPPSFHNIVLLIIL
jgi:hypothetical protein